MKKASRSVAVLLILVLSGMLCLMKPAEAAGIWRRIGGVLVVVGAEFLIIWPKVLGER